VECACSESIASVNRFGKRGASIAERDECIGFSGTIRLDSDRFPISAYSAPGGDGSAFEHE